MGTPFCVGDGGPRSPIDQSATLVSLWLAQRDATPDAPAVTAAGLTLTYSELGQRVDALAAGLLADGAAGRYVGIHVARGIDMLVAVLAVLRAGNAYLPLDPAYPAERLRAKIEDSGAGLVIGSPESAALTKGLGSVRTRTVAGLTESGRHRPGRFPTVWSGDPCYVYFTSGSTGRPRGIRAVHRNVVNFLHGFDAVLQDPALAEPCWLALTSLSFDPCVVELLWTLTRGHHIVLAAPGSGLELVAAGELASALTRQQVTHLQCTPSMLQLMLADPRTRSALRTVRHLLVGGEALTAQLANDALDALCGGRLTNVYGPTETTVWCFAHDVSRGDTDPIPIGRPLANVEIAVLDSFGVSVPAGGIGELWLAGPGVADGYLLPASPAPGSPQRSGFVDGSYGSGDLVRRRDDASLEYRGRADDQAKISGHRIELAEVETAVAGEAGVGRAVAVVDDGKLIVAVLLKDPRVPIDPGDLLAAAARLLPPAVVPAEIVTVASLPFTPSGKVDRRALVKELRSGGNDHLSVAELQALFAELFGRADVGPDTDFFAAGGHSVLAVRLLGRVFERCGVRLGLAAMVGHNTPARLHDLILGQMLDSPNRHDTTHSCLVPLKVDGDRAPFFSVHGVGGNVVNLIPLAKAFPAHRGLYGIQAHGVDGRGEPDLTIGAMAARYAGCIRSVQGHGPYYLGGYSDGGIIALEVARLLAATGERIAALVLFDSEPPEVGGRGFGQRWRNMKQNARADGTVAVSSGVARAVRRRLSPWTHRAERALGYGDARGLGYLDLTDSIGEALLTNQRRTYPYDVVLVRAAKQRPGDRPVSAWADFLTGPFEVLAAPGDHLRMFSAEHAPSLAGVLTKALDARP